MQTTKGKIINVATLFIKVHAIYKGVFVEIFSASNNQMLICAGIVTKG